MEAIKRVNRILEHPLYTKEYDHLQFLEKDREFCRHTMEHFLDVARAGWIMNLEEDLGLSKEVMYAAGLLHDIGKGRQYEFGSPHNEAGAEIAEVILTDCDFTEEERNIITKAILLHRKPVEADHPLIKVLYMADKKTRLCFSCPAEPGCNWSEEKKNRLITV